MQKHGDNLFVNDIGGYSQQVEKMGAGLYASQRDGVRIGAGEKMTKRPGFVIIQDNFVRLILDVEADRSIPLTPIIQRIEIK